MIRFITLEHVFTSLEKEPCYHVTCIETAIMRLTSKRFILKKHDEFQKLLYVKFLFVNLS